MKLNFGHPVADVCRFFEHQTIATLDFKGNNLARHALDLCCDGALYGRKAIVQSVVDSKVGYPGLIYLQPYWTPGATGVENWSPIPTPVYNQHVRLKGLGIIAL